MRQGQAEGESTARRAFVTTAVAVLVIAAALALWHLRLVIFLLFLGFTIAAAMRPGVERLNRIGVPRPAGVLLHFAALAGLIALFLWLVVPPAINQVTHAIGSVPTSSGELRKAAKNSTGIKHEFLVGLQGRLKKLPSGTSLVHPAMTVTTKAIEVLIGIFFTFAIAAYWIFERDRAEDLVLSAVPRRKRRVVRETWRLVDLRLGAFVRGQLLMITLVSTMLSIGFFAIGLPYWLLLGVFGGILEVVPVVGPLAAGAVAVVAGLTIDWRHAVYAACIVLGLRMLQDYVIGPRVFGHAVGISPLIVLVTVTSMGLLFGGVYVLVSVPIAALLTTLYEVIVMERDPAEQEVPTIIFSAKDSEG